MMNTITLLGTKVLRLWIKVLCLFCGLTPCYLIGVDTEPWGKDAELVAFSQQSDTPITSSGPLATLAETLIHFHQQVLSQADGPRSHFLPTSSQYALIAIRKYGFFKGYVLACDRLLRENNEVWIYPTKVTRDGHLYKVDPVP